MELTSKNVSVSASLAKRPADQSRPDIPGIKHKPGERLENGPPRVEGSRSEKVVNVLKERVRYSVDRASGKLVMEPVPSRESGGRFLDSRDVIDLEGRNAKQRHGTLVDRVG